MYAVSLSLRPNNYCNDRESARNVNGWIFSIMIIIAVVVTLCVIFVCVHYSFHCYCDVQCMECTFSSVCKSKSYMNACHPNRVQALSYNSGCFSVIFSCMHKKETSLEATKEKHFCSSFQQQHSGSSDGIQCSANWKACAGANSYLWKCPVHNHYKFVRFRLNKMVFLVLACCFFPSLLHSCDWMNETQTHTIAYWIEMQPHASSQAQARHA